MSETLTSLLCTFTVPEHIGTDIFSMLWMFPLLAAISLIYKATKMRVLFWDKFFKEASILFITTSMFMIIAGVGLFILVHIITT